MLNGYYYFNSGVTHWVVQIMSLDRETGQALCKIDRVLEEWWKYRGDSKYRHARWRHTQPHQGMEIELPMDMLRRCQRNLKLRAPRVEPEPFNWGKLILAGCLILSAFILIR